MSHGDTILEAPHNFKVTTSTESVKVAGFKIDNEDTYGIQFHPEVYHTTEGAKLLRNFLVDICGCSQSWTPDSFIDLTINALQKKLGNDKVVLGLSGGVDSSVAAVLLNKAIGSNLYCIFVDNGLLRKNEFSEVLDSYKNLGLNVKGVDATDKFMDALEGVTDPEKKRKAIGNAFIEVFDYEAQLIVNARIRE
jgi:GMP synthase (glutamine-hydrolysing)